MKTQRVVLILSVSCVLLSCMPSPLQKPQRPAIPAVEYSKRLRQEYRYQNRNLDNGSHLPVLQSPGSFKSHAPAMQNGASPARMADNRAQLRMVKDWPAEPTIPPTYDRNQDVVRNYGAPQDDLYVQRSQRPFERDYQGPLALGNPGTSPSLWQESRRGNDLFRDERAWQPLDLVTIVVAESSEGTKEADTEVKESASILHAISNLFGYENDVTSSNTLSGDTTSRVDLANLINASTTNDFKGEGDTTRKGELRATISAMVVEVLPGGILRIEGERILAVNAEEQVMVISGLVRPRDISSTNEVQSSKLANLRIDYYGQGVVGEAQDGGWLSRFVRKVWPF